MARAQTLQFCQVIFQPIGHRPEKPTPAFEYRTEREQLEKILLISRIRWGVSGKPVTISAADQKILQGRTEVARYFLLVSDTAPTFTDKKGGTQ